MAHDIQCTAQAIRNHRRKVIGLTTAITSLILILFLKQRSHFPNMEKPTAERRTAAEEMEEIIIRNREHILSYRSDAANFSVLNDAYYTVQPDRFATDVSPELKCEEMRFRYSDFKLCPHSPHDPMMNALRGRVMHDFEMSIIVRILQEVPNAAFIDVGANMGMFLIPALLATGYDVRAIAVEPMPNNMRSLMAALNANKVRRDSYALIERVLADTVDENLAFTADTSGTVGSIAHKTIAQHSSAVIQVRTATIDSHVLPVAKAMNISTAILKIDIEGAECLAIQSARKFLANVFVPYIMMEHEMDHVRDLECVEKAHQMLRGMSYHPYYDFIYGPNGALDTKTHMSWGFPVWRELGLYSDIVWKKIL